MALVQDIRLTLRLLRRAPAAAGIAWLSIALSVAATAVVFAAVKAVLIEPLPYADAGRLVQLRTEFPKMNKQSSGDWVVWNDTVEVPRRTRTLGLLGVYGNAVLNLAGDAHSTPEALYGIRMNSALFRVLGVAPMLGRNLLPEEDEPGHADVTILSYGLWVRRFHADRGIVGRSVTVDGHACQVIGVMAADFNFPLRRQATRTPEPYVEFWAAPLKGAGNPLAGAGAVARLRPGVSLAEARQDLAGISRDLAHDFPALDRDRVLKVNALRDRALGPAAKALWLLLAAACLFMLIGCANVANLLLARGLARQREMAVRLALGASQGRIVRQLLTESCVLAVLGGLGGYALAALAWQVLPALAPVSIPRLAAARADSMVLAFAMAAAMLNGILFGIAPALRMSRWKQWGVRGTAGRDRVRGFLVAAEVAVAVLLVITGGEVLGASARLVKEDPGFDARHVVASVLLAAPERYRTPEQRGLFYRRVLDAVRAMPGIESAGTVDALPFSGEDHGGFVSLGLADPQALDAEIDVTGGNYLQSMGIRLDEGRWFRPEEMAPGGDSAIVNTLLARHFWPGKSAIGKRICVYCTPENPDNWKRIVGVVASASHAALGERNMGIYLAAGALQKAQFLVVRTARPAGEVERAIRRAIAAIDPNQPVLLSATMGQLVADSVAARRFIMLLLASTGALALLMAAAGIYGVISYTTARRTPEIAVRMAVGATPERIFALIFRQGFGTVAIGLAGGLGAALVAVRLLHGVIFGLGPGHAGSIGIAAAVVAATAALACWIPARRATRTDPSAALREE